MRSNVESAFNELPPLPDVAMRLIRATNDDRAGQSAIVSILRSDAALTAEVLRRANSPMFGLSAKVSTASQAVMLLGTDEIRRLATMISLDQHFGRAQTAMRRLWRTAFARALLAERLASSFTVASEAAYTAGLLADIGLYGFLVSFQEMGRLIVEQARTPEAMIQAESREFGVNHCQAGGWLARQWLLPETIAVAVTGHHERSASPEALSVPVYWADRVAASLAFGFLGPALGKADLAQYDHVRRSVGLPSQVLPEDAEELFDWLVRRVPS